MTARPDVAPSPDYTFPIAAEHRAGNGLRVLLQDVPGQYVLSVRLLVPLRLADEPQGREGVAAMMARLLDEGTRRHDPEEYAELLERCGAALGAGVSDGGLSVDLDVPARRLRPALELLTEAVAEPAFVDAEVNRILSTRLAEIEQERASAPHRASRELIATLYAAADRASRPTSGSTASISSLTRADVVDFHATRVGPEGGTVVVAGDLAGAGGAEAVLGAVEETLGGWTNPRHTPAERPTAPVRDARASRFVLVDRPGSVQSELLLAAIGPNRSLGAGWAPFPVLSFLIGGSPTARLDAVLREEKGYTYGMRCSFRPRVAGGTFVTSGSVRSEVTAEALVVLLDLLADVGRDGFTEDEVRRGVDYVSKTAPARYATADAIADETTSLALEGLAPDFPTEILRRMAELDPVSVTQAWRSVVPEDGWTVVVVGDAASILEPLRAAGFSDIEVVPA